MFAKIFLNLIPLSLNFPRPKSGGFLLKLIPNRRILTEMWHPNIDKEGKVCISILHEPGGFSHGNTFKCTNGPNVPNNFEWTPLDVDQLCSQGTIGSDMRRLVRGGCPFTLWRPSSSQVIFSHLCPTCPRLSPYPQLLANLQWSPCLLTPTMRALPMWMQLRNGGTPILSSSNMSKENYC